MEYLKGLQLEIQALVAFINAKHQHPHPELINFLKVVEELGEVSEVVLTSQIKSRKSDKLSKESVAAKLGPELADCVIALISLANDYDIDLDEYLRPKLQKHFERVNKY